MKEIKLKFKVLGQAKPKQSVKFTRSGMRYTPKDAVIYANWIRNSFIIAYPKHKPEMLEGYYLDVELNAYFKIPESFSKKKKEQALKGLLRYDKRPDVDNLQKCQFDALNGIAYPDDRAIVDVSVHKYYAESDYVEISIRGFKYE